MSASSTLEDARAVWRTLAEEAKAKDGRGVRLAEQIVGAVFTIADHLRTASGKYRVPENACLRPAKWRKLLKDDWHAVTGKEVQPRRLRYDRKELEPSSEGCVRPTTPGYAPPGVYGIGYRRAHVVRVRRSMLDLGPVGPYSCGRLTIPGGRRKKP